MMDPLSRFLIDELRATGNSGARRWKDLEDALVEMGYWLLQRLEGEDRHKMPECGINTECEYVESFTAYVPPSEYMPGYNIVVDVYREREAVCNEQVQ